MTTESHTSKSRNTENHSNFHKTIRENVDDINSQNKKLAF